MSQQNHISLLGLRARDAVTGFNGVISTVSFDLYGCVQAVITPRVDDNGKIKDGQWFDVTRLVILDNKPVMTQPDFNAGYVAEGKKGCADKPLP
jgi:hypothetical protein